MRLRMAHQQQIVMKPPLPRAVYQAEEGPAFDQETCQVVSATVRPLSAQAYAAVYGERVKRMLLVLVDADVDIWEGVGLCVDVPPEAACDYRVAVPPERWARHKRVIAEKLP